MKFPDTVPASQQSVYDQYAPAFRRIAGPPGEDPVVYPLLFSIAATLFESSRQGPVTFSVAGSQGSGKTTMSRLLVSLLAD
ncbi:MAG: hypothetical protein O3B72_06550, partial [Proteobacteria bacterium]|nr:hypothetical protein [Pseudomonadota bacterium]